VTAEGAARARSAPIVETDRLRLRSFQEGDLDAQAATLGDPEVMRFIGAQPISREEAWRKMLAAPGLWAMLGYGYWAVERKQDGVLLGQVGFADFKRDIQPSLEGIPEMGWIFAPHAHGQGYAGEAVAAGLVWADAHLHASQICCIIAPDNAPSIKVAQKAGFRESATTTYKGEPTLILRRGAP
jgi:RimJ/RimL family protein N-acetyltransferase